MDLGQRLLPLGVDKVTSAQYLKSDKAFFLKGLETTWLVNNGSGSNALELKPSESNFLYTTVLLPVTGENTVIGYYYFQEANEGYVVVYNSEGYHFIYRIRGNDGTAEIVYNFCRWFKGITNKPKDYFSEGRIVIKSLCKIFPDGSKELFKSLHLVNKKVDNIQIIVEDSIATDSFSTPFFNPIDGCCGSRCRIIKTGVPTPMGQIKVVPIPATSADKLVQNLMMDQMFQFRFLYVNAWGQRSEHGIISKDPYFNNISGCSKDRVNQPHCVWLEAKTPCPEIVQIVVEKKSCQLLNGGIGNDGNSLSEWKEVFTIDLYDKTDINLKWYQRKYNTTSKDFEFFNNGKKIRIKFCNNRECIPIANSDIRNQNPSPINSGSVAPIGKGLAYADNENDLPPFPKEFIDSIKFELIKEPACEPKYSNIKVWAVVNNNDEKINEPVYELNGISGFGGFGQKDLRLMKYEQNTFSPKKGLSENGGFGQVFPEGISNFRGILAGASVIVEAKQFLWTPSSLVEINTLNLPYLELNKYVRDAVKNGHILVQCFDFGLQKCGTNYFRIVGHNDTENLEFTSTYYRNNMPWSQYRTGQRAFIGGDQKEIFIDTSNGQDFDSMTSIDTIAVIQDLTYPGNNAFAVDFYLQKDKLSKEPVELAEIHKNRGSEGVVGYTDHNGFGFWTTQYGQDYKIQLKSAIKCTYGQLLAQSENKENKGTTSLPYLYVIDKHPTVVNDLCFSYIISGKIAECVTGGGIEGIAVILGRTRPVYTNSQGEFKVIAHYSNGRGNDKLIFSVASSCTIVDCNCGPVNVQIQVTQPSCVNCTQNSVNVGNFSLKTIVTKGFPKNSRIPIGMKGIDSLGRETAIQTSEKLIVDFPSEQEQGDSTYRSLKIILPDVFPAYMCQNYKHITFSFGNNLLYSDWLEWAADKVEFIDAAGNINSINPLKVRIWWRSLNEYNLKRGLKTNTNWSFKNAVLDNKGTQVNNNTDGLPLFNGQVGDVVEFIKNADGTYLPPNVTSNVQYELSGSYFLVDFDESLRVLKDGVKFKVKRPYQCEVKTKFYEFGFPLNFCGEDCRLRDDEGNIVKEFIMDAFSSYSLPRQIPVITDVTTTVNGQDKITEVKTMKVYPFTFEHHSPSDTWGDHCHSGGRVSYVNKYEGKRCDRTQILLTGALNQATDGAINYLHYFSYADEFVLDEQGFGKITALLCRDDQQVLVICDLTVFSFRFNDNRAVVTEQGYISVPVNNRFSRPERNPFFNFGCQENDINTIRRIDSLVCFLDSQKQAFIIHDFSQAQDVSTADMQSWLVPSIKEVKKYPDTKFWHCCFDLRLHKIFLTKHDLSTKQIVNNEIDDRVELSETVSYDYLSKEWRQSHFTPEYFGNMYSDQKDSQFFSFKNALPYSHHNAVNPGSLFLNYFGIQCFPVIGVATNEKGTEEKSFISTEVYCREIGWIMKKIKTSMGQQSETLEGQWENGGGISYAPYLCDTGNADQCNSDIQEAIFDGDSLYGSWLIATYLPPIYNGEFFLLKVIISYYEIRSKR